MKETIEEMQYHINHTEGSRINGKSSIDMTTEFSNNSYKDDEELCGLINQNKVSLQENEISSELLNSIIDSMGMSSYLIKVIMFGILTCFSDGSEMVVVSLIMRKLETKWKLTPMKKAFIGGSIFDGFLVGALISGKLMDGKGRKFTLVFGSLIFLLFGIASSIATEFYSFMLFRIGVGLGLGFVIPTTQTFITELSPQKYRGFNSILIWLGFPLGEMYICYVSHLFPLDDLTYHQENWQLIMILAALPIFLNISLLIFFYETPRYHLLKNNFEEAFDILNLMKKESISKSKRQKSNDLPDCIEMPQLDEKTKSDLKIYYIVKKSEVADVGFLSTLVPKFRDQSIKLWTLWFAVSYIFYGVLYLIPELVGKQKDKVTFEDLVEAVVFSTFFEIIGIISTFMIECESIGRLGSFRISFVLCFILSTLCMFKMRGWIMFLHILKGASQISTRALYIYTSECYPTEIRGIALGLGNGFTRLAGILTPLINEFLLSFSSNYCFLGISIASFISAVISFKFNTETLNRRID